MSFDEWMSLSSNKRYQLKKTYKKFNIDIPNQDEGDERDFLKTL